MKPCCSKRTNRHCWKIPFFTGLLAGGIYGMLFTKTAGPELRMKIKKSKKPCADLFIAGAEMDMSFIKWVINAIRKKLS